MVQEFTCDKQACSPQAAASIGWAILDAEAANDRDKEHFWVIGLNTKNRVKYVDLVTLGTLDASLVHPREVFRFAVMQGVSSILLMHNHPSGDPTPSKEDISVTTRLSEAGKVLGIEVLDHVIIGNDSTRWASHRNGW